MSHTLYFIRHGQTDWNAELRFQGQRDIPLNATGRAQARRNGEALARHLPDPDALDFVASPLGRARETMEIVRAAMGLDVAAYRTDDRLKELTFGVWEGRTLHEIKRLEPADYAARKADRWGFAPADGESYALLTLRISPLLDAIAGDTVVVSHGGVMRCLRALACRVSPEEAPHLETPQDRIMVVRDGAVTWL